LPSIYFDLLILWQEALHPAESIPWIFKSVLRPLAGKPTQMLDSDCHFLVHYIFMTIMLQKCH
jgi:hypothetical protein